MSWYPQQLDELESRHFGSWQDALNVEGCVLSGSLMSRLKKVNLEGRSYYVKIYHSSGRHLRRYLGRSRVRAEWENLLYFQSIGLPTVRLVAFGEEDGFSGSRKGMLITEEVPNSRDLASLVLENDPLLKNKKWLNEVLDQVAENARLLHRHGFVHGDLKWRNILVNLDGEPHIYFIDCPLGRKYPFFLMERGIVKDLACLDKVAKYHLSVSSRMKFYHRYTHKTKISVQDKRRIGRILQFFHGRE